VSNEEHAYDAVAAAKDDNKEGKVLREIAAAAVTLAIEK
jgi:hypothetical protein